MLRATILLAISVLPVSATTVIRCGQLVDVRKGTLIANASIFIEGGVISAVQTVSNSEIPSGATVIDLSRGTCLPGLTDVHDHLTADPKDEGYESLGVS